LGIARRRRGASITIRIDRPDEEPSPDYPPRVRRRVGRNTRHLLTHLTEEHLLGSDLSSGHERGRDHQHPARRPAVAQVQNRQGGTIATVYGGVRIWARGRRALGRGARRDKHLRGQEGVCRMLRRLRPRPGSPERDQRVCRPRRAGRPAASGPSVRAPPPRGRPLFGPRPRSPPSKSLNARATRTPSRARHRGQLSSAAEGRPKRVPQRSHVYISLPPLDWWVSNVGHRLVRHKVSPGESLARSA
jgi:hypothetical protein